MSIQPVIGTPGVYAAKMASQGEVFLHPDRVTYRVSTRPLHRLSVDWESESQTLKAGTVMSLRPVSTSDNRAYWLPWILTSNHLSHTGEGINYILLPQAFLKYSDLFPSGARFTRVTLATSGLLEYTHISSTAAVTSFTLSGTTYAAIPVASITSAWANNSILLYHGVGVGPTGTDSVFRDVDAVTVIPGDTLVDQSKHSQLHHIPWSGVVIGRSLRPKSTVSGQQQARDKLVRLFLRECSSRGFTGIILDD